MLENSRYNYFDGDLSLAVAALLVSPIQRLLNGLPQNCYPLLRLSHKPIPSYNSALRVVVQAYRIQLFTDLAAILRVSGKIGFGL
jgi:hypothetical protein